MPKLMLYLSLLLLCHLPLCSDQHHLLHGFSQQLQTVGPLGAEEEPSQDLAGPWQQYSGTLESCEVPASPACTNPSLRIPTNGAEWEDLPCTPLERLWQITPDLKATGWPSLSRKLICLKRQVLGH